MTENIAQRAVASFAVCFPNMAVEDCLMIWFTGVVALSTLVYAILTWRLVTETRRLREALTNTTGFQGIIGVIACDRFGDCGSGRAEIRYHTDASITDFAALPVVYRYSR